DHDRTAESRELVSALTASGYFRVVATSDDSRELGRALDSGRALVGLDIPVGYARDLAAGRSPAVQLLVDGTNSNTATVAQGYALRIAADLGARGLPVVDGRPMGIDLRARAWFNPSLESRV